MRQPFTFTTLLSSLHPPCQLSCRGWWSWRPEAGMARLEKLEGMSSLVRTQASPLWISAWGWMESFWQSNVDHVPELGVKGVHGHVQPLQEEIKIRTHVDKVCSLWPLNLDWDISVFVNFRFAIFQFCISPKYAFSDFLPIGSKFGHLVTSFALVPKLATRLCNLHCHIVLDCPVGIIS